MPRIRFLILGLLLVSGAVIAAELALRHNYEDACVQLGLNGGDAGWSPCETGFLQAPANRVIRYPVRPGDAVDLRYDANGFRVTAETTDDDRQPTIFLGSRRVLAPDLPAEQTFVGLWESSTTGFPSQQVVLNGGMPRGCPLLWQLQFDTRLATTSARRLICVIGVDSCENDFIVRRSIKFDAQGRPQIGLHPGKSAEPKSNAAQELIEQYRLVQVGLPMIGNVFFGREPASDPFESRLQLSANGSLTTELIEQALVPLIDLSQRASSRGTKLTVVYLPTADELALQAGISQSERDSLVENCRSVARDFTARHQLEFLDLTTHLVEDEAGSRLFRPDGRRLTESGHQRVSKVLSEAFTPRLASQPIERSVQ